MKIRVNYRRKLRSHPNKSEWCGNLRPVSDATLSVCALIITCIITCTTWSSFILLIITLFSPSVTFVSILTLRSSAIGSRLIRGRPLLPGIRITFSLFVLFVDSDFELEIETSITSRDNSLIFHFIIHLINLLFE